MYNATIGLELQTYCRFRCHELSTAACCFLANRIQSLRRDHITKSVWLRMQSPAPEKVNSAHMLTRATLKQFLPNRMGQEKQSQGNATIQRLVMHMLTSFVCEWLTDKSVTTSRFAKLMTDKDVVSRHRCSNANPVDTRRMALFLCGHLEPNVVGQVFDVSSRISG